MNLLLWFNGGDQMPGARYDMLWAGGTLALSLIIALGYAAIAFNWYFQSKLSRVTEARAAIARLRNICLASAACGFVFYATEMPWLIWRLYDLTLLFIAFYTWSFRMRGLSLVDDRLAQLNELERSANKYREIAELLPYMVWTATAEGLIDFSNQRWREYAGDQRTWVQAIHPDDCTYALARWNHALATRGPLNLEARLAGAAGYRTFAIKATAIAEGDAIKWLGACADVEDQKLLAQERETQAKQKSFFLNALSHDLRAPLHNVLLNAQLIKMSPPDHLDGESVDMIVENAIAAGDLVARLLDFAKVGAQEHNTLETFSLAAAVQHIIRRFQPLAEQKGLDLRYEVGAHSPRSGRTEGPPVLSILTDRQKVERILSNLVDNAIKYTPRGSVTLSLSATENHLAVRITDTGIGIPVANVPFLFDEFYQVNNYERDRSKGFGMGLAICRSLARQIGSDIRLASTSPQGSCFELLLKNVGPDRGGRPIGTQSDQRHPQTSRLSSR
jgi:signal transduction histidine kinase